MQATTLTLANGIDERMLYLMDGETQWAVLNIVEAVEAATPKTLCKVHEPGACYWDCPDAYAAPDAEPEYTTLTDELVEMVTETLRHAGWQPQNPRALRFAVEKHITPGGVQLGVPTFVAEVQERFLPQQQRGSDDAAFDTGSGRVKVSIDDDGEEGNRATDKPTIMVALDHRYLLRLTWQEARALAAALTEVTDTAELG